MLVEEREASVLYRSEYNPVSARQSRAAWARLLAKVYEVDALRCNRCGSLMKVIALITDPQQCRRILLHLIKTGVAPPGLDASVLN